MDKRFEIKLNGKICVLFFGYACFRLLAAKWSVPGYRGVLEKLATFEDGTGEVEVIGDLVEAALLANPEKQPVMDFDEIMDGLLDDMDLIEKVTTALLAVVTKPTTEGAGKLVAEKV